jgi:tetratricopeptide (TPR) repeat protein
VISVRQAVRATRAERTANAERDAATAASRAEALARADAQRRQEQAEDLLTFMLGDFRTELQKIGRLQLLDAVGAKAMAYFAALNPRDLTDTALSRQARALTQIGETRMDEARYPEAAAAFATAYERAAALSARHPRDADLLFERAQAEYWIGFVSRRQGNFQNEGEWFTRYRDSTATLFLIEGPSPRARREVAFGHHNLAVLDFDRAHLTAARKGFLAEVETLKAMVAASPADLNLQSGLADAAGWLGRVAERSGHLAEALEQFSTQAAMLESLARQEPSTARWLFRLADSLVFQAGVRIARGEGEAAAEILARARALMDALVTQDPKNRPWLATQANLRLTILSLPAADLASRQLDLDAIRARLAELVAAEPSDRSYPARLATAWRLEARFRLAAARADAAEAAARAVEIGESLMKDTRADDRLIGELAQSYLIAGGIARTMGKNGRAHQCWDHVIDLLGSRATGSNDWRLLDPLARAFACLGRQAESRALTERLGALGYHPLEPWPANAASDPSVSPNHD